MAYPKGKTALQWRCCVQFDGAMETEL